MTTDIQAIQLNSQIPTPETFNRRLSANQMFSQFASLIKRHPFVKTLAKREDSRLSPILENKNTIKPKMFTKLVNWMLKLCSQTLDFSVETFQIAIQILRSYLEKSSTLPNELQMLGCISLHMASKVNEKTIVAVESYMECCMNIFSRKQFEEKETEVYKKLGGQIPTFTMHTALYFLQSEIVSHRNIPEIQSGVIQAFLKQSMLELKFLDIDPLAFISNLLVEIMCTPDFKINSQQFLALLYARKLQY